MVDEVHTVIKMLKIAKYISSPFQLGRELHKFTFEMDYLNNYSNVKNLINSWVEKHWCLPEGKTVVKEFLKLNAKISEKESKKEHATDKELTEWARLKRIVEDFITKAR